MKETPKLHPFEYIGAHKLYTEGRFLLADEMGMFKTAQAIFANSKFREKKGNLRSLIIAPTSVREHWARELDKWAYPNGETNIVYAHNINETIRKARDATWTIMSYPLLSRLGEDHLKHLRDTGFHHVIGDEIHNAKNPNALRTRAIKGLIDQADHVSLLSGTPIPNTIADLYVLMSMLDPAQYPFDPEKDEDSSVVRAARQSFIQQYFEHPQAVKELFHRKMLRRTAGDYLSDQLPEVEIQRVPIPLTGKHLEAYKRILDTDTNVGEKFTGLAKASLDPCLVNKSLPRMLRGENASLKYRKLEEIVEEETSRPNGKVLVFTDLKTGVIDYLLEAYKEQGAVAITGDIPTEGGEREEIRYRFQRDPNTRVLFATTVMNEGVDLTAATAVVDLTVPLTPAARLQRWKRTDRPGEVKKDKVRVYTLYTTIPGPQQSLEEAELGMVDSKQQTADYLINGMQVSAEQLRGYDETSRVPQIVHAITSPSKAVFKVYLRWRGIGSERALKRMRDDPDTARYVAELYPQFSMTRNAANIYLPIIRRLEEKRPLRTKVDIGCGPGMLGHFLGEPTIGIDLNPHMIEVGRKLYPENKLIEGKMSELPVRSSIADLTVCSLAYQMNEPKRERSQSLLEMSRVLKVGGHAIITIPGKYTTPEEEARFERVAGRYGLEVEDHQHEVGPSKIDFYLFRKARKATSNRPYDLRWKGDPGVKKK